MTIVTTRIDDLTGLRIESPEYVEISVTVRRVSNSWGGPFKTRQYHSVNERMFAACQLEEASPELSTILLDFLRKLIRDELESAQT